MSKQITASEAEHRRLKIEDEILWIKEAALTMRIKFDSKEEYEIGKESDGTALRILARLESIRAELRCGVKG